MAKIERPLSPHLQIYRWQITMALSALHRITGVALGAGAVLLSAWIIAAALSPEAYATAQGWLGSIVGRLILLGFTWAFFFHFANGIRHLAWDLGYGFDMPAVRKSGWSVVVISMVATLLVWALAYGLGV